MLFTVLSPRHNHCKSSLGSCDKCILSVKVAANPQTKLNDYGIESTCRLLPSIPTVAIYYYYSVQRLILILPSHRG